MYTEEQEQLTPTKTAIHGGLFIALYDEDSLKLYLNKGLYGFLMNPVRTDKPSSRSRYYAILADYACSREGTDVFFFLKRKIVYGGKIYGNKDVGSFFLNGGTSPLGRAANAHLFWDESKRKKYIPTENAGVFRIVKEGAPKSQPFIFQFIHSEQTGKYITSDDLYLQLGKYPYPLPSNSMQGMGFCTLTPGEVLTLNSLIETSKKRINFNEEFEVDKDGEEVVFSEDLVSLKDDLINEAQLEFTILSSLKPFKGFLTDDYLLCRQVPISPFKPIDMDRADICLYSMTNPIKNGTIPNVIIELKREKANMKAYEQVTRYLRWIEMITTDEEFSHITAYIIAPSFVRIKRSAADLTFEHKIFMYNVSTEKFETLAN